MSGYGYNYTNQNNTRYHHDYYHDDAPPEQYDESSSSSPYHPHPNPTYGYHDDSYSNVISSTTTEGYPLDNVGMYEDYYGRGRSSRSDTSTAAAAGGGGGGVEEEEEEDILLQQQQQHQQQQQQQQQGEGSSVSDAVDNNDGDDDVDDVDFDDPRIANLPRILMMGPRRAGKTSIQRVVFHKMSPHETLFRLEATQNLERSVVDHTPLCRFTIWDFPGDYYGPEDNPSSIMSREDDHDDMNSGARRQGMPVNVISMMRQPPVHVGGRDASPSGHRSGYNHGGGGGGGHNNHVMNDTLNHNNNLSFGAVSGSGGGNGSFHHHPHLHLHHHLEDNHPSSSPTAGGGGDGDAQIFARATALIFVLDAQDEPYDHVLQHFTETVRRAARANPHIAIEVFINKVDGELFLSDEAKYDCRRDVMQQVSDELADAGVMPDSVQISYHLTSIYDHSVFDAFSRVVQKLIPQLPTLENLLNVLVSTCAMEKAYLFDVASKLYISTDSSPVDMQSVELCSDMIDVVLDVSGIYGLPPSGGGGENNGVQNSAHVMGDKLLSSTDGMDSMAPVAGEMASLTSGGDPSMILSDSQGNKKTYDMASSSSPIENDDELVGTLIGQMGDALFTEDILQEVEKDDTGTAYDSDSASVIRLSKGMILYLKEVDTMLALVCLTRSDNFRKRNLINYNIRCLKKALRSLVHPSS